MRAFVSHPALLIQCAQRPGSFAVMLRLIRWSVFPIVGLLSALSAARVEANLTSIGVATGAGEVSLITPQEGAVGISAFNQGGHVLVSAANMPMVNDTANSAPMGLLDLLYGRGNYTARERST